MSHQEPPREQPEPQQQDTTEPEVPDPEVVVDAVRRQFPVNYKLRILDEADRCTNRKQVGELLRREGLYASYLSKWRVQRAQGQLQGLSPKKRGRPPTQGPAAAELDRLRRENERLRAKLAQAEAIIDVQKKLATLLGLTSDETESNEHES